MPTVTLSPDVDLFYQVDDFTDPWTMPETVIFLHGLAERGDAWRAWVPHFARHYRVIRLDQRGFGASTPMPVEFDWSIDVPVDDLAHVVRQLKLSRFHLVSAKFGGTVAMRFAAKYPEMVKSLSIVSAPTSLRKSLGTKIPEWDVLVKSGGVRGWAAATMGGRLGNAMPPVAQAWWADMMGQTADSTVLGIFRTLAQIDVTADLPNIQCPALVITTTGSSLGSVDDVGAWQRTIPHSELLALDNDSYHIAASEPDQCAEAVAAFIGKHTTRTSCATPAYRPLP
jgi:3-oxoadipate enol-lactonase